MVCTPHQYTIVKLAGYNQPRNYQALEQPQAYNPMMEQRPLYQTRQPSMRREMYSPRTQQKYEARTEKIRREEYTSPPSKKRDVDRLYAPRQSPTLKTARSYELFPPLLYQAGKMKPQDLEHRRDRLTQLIERELRQTQRENNHVQYN